jgi:hypothetical protein
MRRPTRALALVAALGLMISAFVFGGRPTAYADPSPTPTPTSVNNGGGGTGGSGSGGGGHSGG